MTFHETPDWLMIVNVIRMELGSISSPILLMAEIRRTTGDVQNPINNGIKEPLQAVHITNKSKWCRMCSLGLVYTKPNMLGVDS